MLQRTLRTKSLQRIACALLILIMLVGLLSTGGVATEVAAPGAFATPIAWGYVGPSGALPAPWAPLAPWTLYDDGTVVIGAGDVRGINLIDGSAWGGEPTVSPWDAYRNLVQHIVFTEPVNAVANLSGLFANLPNLTAIDGFEYFNINTVGEQVWMSNLFRGSSSLTTLDVSDWDVSNVTRFRSMFRDASGLHTIIGINDWTTSSLHTMPDLFLNASSLTELDLSNWDTSRVTGGSGNGMHRAFQGMAGLTTLNLAGWDTTTAQTVTPPGQREGSLLSAAGMGDMFAGSSSLRQLTLGSNWGVAPDANTNLPEPPNNATYTGMWVNVGNGTIYAPEETHTFTSAQLMNVTSAPYSADTWVWQRRIPLLLVIFESAGNGTITPALTVTEPNGTIAPSLAIHPMPNTGFQFLHWTSSDPAHTGGPFQTSDLYGLIITQNTTFTAYFGSHLPLLSRQAYLIGTPDDRIRPNTNITRAEVATIFFRLITDEVRAMYWVQENPFSDVELQNWFNNAVSTMSNANIFDGFPNGTFVPNQPITRAEMTAVVVRFMEQMDGTHLLANHFNDIASHWAAEYINTAAVNGWVQDLHGRDGAFYPDRPITRAEVAAMINRISGRLVAYVEDLLPGMRIWPDNANVNARYYFDIQSATNAYTFSWRDADNVVERWVTIIPPRDWAVLERPDSRPGDILYP